MRSNIILKTLKVILLSMPNPTSQIQQHFQMHSVYKRSRRYFDIQKLNLIEHKEELTRRKPSLSGQSMIVGGRVDEEWVCSQEQVNERVRKQIQRKKKYRQDDWGDADTSYSFTAPLKPVVPNMAKMLPRSSLSSSKPTYQHERQFHNFQHLQLPSNSIDFNKFISRQKVQRRKQVSSMEADGQKVGKQKQYVKYDRGVYACLVRYREKEDTKGNNPEQPTPISIQKIRQAQNHARPNVSAMQHSFYQSVTRQVMPMIAQKTVSPLQNFYISKKNQEKQDFIISKKKEDMTLKRLQGLLARKHIKDVREQGCDQKYFKRNSIENL